MRGKAYTTHNWISGFLYLFIIVILVFPGMADAQGTNANTYMYITCGNPVFIAPGPDTVCFDLMYHIEGTGSEKITV